MCDKLTKNTCAKKMFSKLKKYFLNNNDGVKAGHVHKQLFVTLSLATTLLTYGLQNGWISPMKKVLQSDASPTVIPLTDHEISWVASSMSLTAVLGSFMYAYIADKFGRKIGVIAMIIPQALCWLIKLSSANVVALIIARLIGGLPAGGCFNLVPMYVNEISQANIRGILVALAMACLNIGYVIIFAMGGYLKYYAILWIAVSVPVVNGILVLTIVPESPAFLVKKGKFKEAARTVASLRGLDSNNAIVQNELDYMKNQEETSKAIESITLLSIFKNKAWRRGFLLCIFNLTALNLNGTLCFNMYAWTIITKAGVTVNPELQTLSIPLIMLFGSLMSLLCVEKFGRKPILVGAFILSFVSLSCLATTLLLQHRGGQVPSWIPVLAIIVTMWAYSAGLVPMVYVILSEIFTFQVRAKLIGIIAAYGWFVVFVQIYSYLPMSNNLGMYTTFYIFAAINLIAGVISLICQPETMGKTVEQIEKLLLGEKNV